MTHTDARAILGYGMLLGRAGAWRVGPVDADGRLAVPWAPADDDPIHWAWAVTSQLMEWRGTDTADATPQQVIAAMAGLPVRCVEWGAADNPDLMLVTELTEATADDPVRWDDTRRRLPSPDDALITAALERLGMVSSAPPGWWLCVAVD